uniref:Putative group i salivary lipocalin n=1 Tax=Rhipicephalus pulchellus TaxID=72859 RepID=L7LQH8_RHIPC
MRAGALFLLFGLFFDVQGESVNKLIDALNTNETIWLYKQSYRDNPEAPNRTCVRWHLKSITTSLYTFDNDYKDHKGYHTDYNTNGTLFGKTNSDEMNVTYIREGHRSTNVIYKLNMWDPNEECFVLTVSNANSGKTKCELHVWQRKLKASRPSCDSAYNGMCKEQGPQVFSEHECM